MFAMVTGCVLVRYTLRQLSTVAMDTRHVLSEKCAKAEETDEHQILLLLAQQNWHPQIISY